MAHDLVIRGGFIVDGTGAPGRTGDLAVSGGRIAEVGTVTGLGAREVDARELVVAPGFIDPHTHYDAQLTWDPSASCTSWHGVTTIVTGNCGFTMAPCRPEDRLTLMKMLEYVEGMSLEAMQKGIEWNFETFDEYLGALDRLPLWVNVAPLIGHSAVRQFVMGRAAWERAATDDELLRMAGLRHTGEFITSTAASSIVRKDERLLEFECKLDPDLPPYPEIAVALPGTRAGLTLRGQRIDALYRYLPFEGAGAISDWSLELFNETYWKQDALEVARTGLEKMRAVVRASA